MIKYGYKNIPTFTYGAVNNADAMVSKTCATQLGLSWEFVEYTEEKWKAISESDVFPSI